MKKLQKGGRRSQTVYDTYRRSLNNPVIEPGTAYTGPTGLNTPSPVVVPDPIAIPVSNAPVSTPTRKVTNTAPARYVAQKKQSANSSPNPYGFDEATQTSRYTPVAKKIAMQSYTNPAAQQENNSSTARFSNLVYSGPPSGLDGFNKKLPIEVRSQPKDKKADITKRIQANDRAYSAVLNAYQEYNKTKIQRPNIAGKSGAGLTAEERKALQEYTSNFNLNKRLSNIYSNKLSTLKNENNQLRSQLTLLNKKK